MQKRFNTTLARACGTAALLSIAALGGCGGDVAEPVVKTRVFTVVSADQQALPAEHACPAPEPGMTAGTRFLEGELTLYAEASYRWRYTIQHYTTRGTHQEVVAQPITSTGTYSTRGEALELRQIGAASPRIARLRGEAVELTEAMPCQYQEPGEPVHEAALYLEAPAS